MQIKVFFNNISFPGDRREVITTDENEWRLAMILSPEREGV